MIDIKELSEENLKHIIENLKAECEKKADALRWYEEEWRRRKTKNQLPLGVPLRNLNGSKACNKYLYFFSSKESSKVFDGWLKDYVEALQRIAKGEPIDIRFLVPLMKKGWVAMDKSGSWHWYAKKPKQGSDEWIATGFITSFHAFNLKPADDWKTSLQECGI